MLQADGLMGICTDPSGASLLGLSNGNGSFPDIKMTLGWCIVFLWPPHPLLSFCFPEPFVKKLWRTSAKFSWVGFKLAPYLVPRINVYLTFCQRECSYYQDVAVYLVISGFVASQPLPWNFSTMSHMQSNDYPLPRDKHQMLQWSLKVSLLRLEKKREVLPTASPWNLVQLTTG